MKIAYWITTVLIALLMGVSGIPDILKIPEAVTIFRHLGYPEYLLPFIGVAKILGAIAILYPGFPRLKEWAYAGIVFDLIGAFYSHLSVGDPFGSLAPPLVGLVLAFASYILYRKRGDAVNPI
jgi:uncharacterized membrane protein YphA (DoxX/SURF4 family)